MDWFLGVLALLLLVAALFGAWRYQQLHKKIAEYNNLLRRSSEDGRPIDHLPADFPGLEDLSNAVKNLAQEIVNQLTTVKTDRDRLSSILERMTDGVIIVDNIGQITFINPAAQRIFGVQNAVGHRITEVLHYFQLVEAWQRCLTRGDSQDQTLELPAQRVFLHMVVVPDSHTGDALILVQDLSQLRRLESVRRDFISNVSHELRTPLASLKALAETLRDGALEDKEVAPRFLARMETEVDALTQMTQELLDLSRIESGQVDLALRTVEPSQLLISSAERMRAQAERAGLILRVEPLPNLPAINGYGTRLEQVLVNLMGNAVKFTDRGEVALDVAVAEETEREAVLHFQVRDTGVGIPKEKHRAIFDAFMQVDESIARKYGGTGLGLTITRRIVTSTPASR